MNDTIK